MDDNDIKMMRESSLNELQALREIVSALHDDPQVMTFITKPRIHTPPCECADCEFCWYNVKEQHRPGFWYTNKITVHQAATIAASYIQQILCDKTYLENCLKLHADALMNRWRKRSIDKRAALVREVAPFLTEELFPLIKYVWIENLRECRSNRSRCLLLLPWLSIAMLKTNPAALFALLHYRTLYPPQDWAAFDFRQHELDWALAWFNVEFSPSFVVMHGRGYGDVVNWEAILAHRGDILGLPRARLVLEAQALLIGTLRKIVDAILDGVDLSGPARSEKWREQTVAGFKKIGEVELWSPYTNGALSKPPLFNADYLVSLAKTRAEAQRDHLIDLQLDLKYLRTYIRNLIETGLFKAGSKDRREWLLAAQINEDVHSYF